MDITNQKFGYLTVLHKGEAYPSGPARWWCRCELCGREKLIGQGALISGGNISCGCKRQTRLPSKVCATCGTTCVRIVCPPRGFRCPTCVNKHRRDMYQADPRSVLLNGARTRAKRGGLAFALTKEDILIPAVCPIFGIQLEIGSRQRHDNSPSLDQLVPGLGYTPENIRVISWRANRIKCDGTLEELEKIVTYMRENGL